MSVSAISSLIAPQPSTITPSATTVSSFLKAYFAERRPEIQDLQTALKSGDLSAAKEAYNNLVALGNKVLGKDNPFLKANRAFDFNAVGGALQNGDLAGAQKAFAALESTFEKQAPPPTSSPLNSPDAVVNLSGGS